MRIAQIAPLQESVPPQRYGGTERIVASLTDELIHRGHEVTLFASGDSRTNATLVPIVPRAPRLAGVRDTRPADILALGMAYERAAEFDIIHSHQDYPTLAFARPAHRPLPCVPRPHLAGERDRGRDPGVDDERRAAEGRRQNRPGR